MLLLTSVGHNYRWGSPATLGPPDHPAAPVSLGPPSSTNRLSIVNSIL